MQTAAIVTIGTELVEGLRLDTNTADIAKQLVAHGFVVVEAVSVGDALGDLTYTLSRLTKTYPLVVVTGGLGPTHDDVTREAASAALGLELVPDSDMLTFLEAYPAAVGGSVGRAVFLSQADILVGAEVLRPARGTAPGQVAPTPAGDLVLLPGPPREMKPLLELYLRRYAATRAPSVDLGVVGLSETEVCDLVFPCLDRDDIGFTVLASPSGVHVLLTDLGSGADALHETASRVAAALGERCYSDDGRSLAEVVIDMARSAGLTIGTVESCTGGMIAAAITAVPGSSDVFVGGLVTYSNELKTKFASVSSDTLRIHGAVSCEVASEMALGAREALGCDIAVSVTGIAGPGGGTAEKPVGTVWFGLSNGYGTITDGRRFNGERDVIRERSAVTALDLVRRELLSHF